MCYFLFSIFDCVFLCFNTSVTECNVFIILPHLITNRVQIISSCFKTVKMVRSVLVISLQQSTLLKLFSL